MHRIRPNMSGSDGLHTTHQTTGSVHATSAVCTCGCPDASRRRWCHEGQVCRLKEDDKPGFDPALMAHSHSPHPQVDSSGPALLSFLEYVYTAHTQVPAAHIEGFLSLTLAYELLPRVQSSCETYLLSRFPLFPVTIHALVPSIWHTDRSKGLGSSAGNVVVQYLWDLWALCFHPKNSSHIRQLEISLLPAKARTSPTTCITIYTVVCTQL